LHDSRKQHAGEELRDAGRTSSARHHHLREKKGRQKCRRENS
jgi:hypothetical protein